MPAQSPAPELAPELTFAGVTKRYAGVAAVDDVSVTIAPGAFVALVGASGSGKSTLLKTVNRLVAPDAGRVLIDGADVAEGPAPSHPLGENVFRRKGQAWQVRFAGGEEFILLPSKGAAYLHLLLQRPG